ncbi:MAG: polyamine aminopropyltransferase [Actinocatenispora sp.]
MTTDNQTPTPAAPDAPTAPGAPTDSDAPTAPDAPTGSAGPDTPTPARRRPSLARFAVLFTVFVCAVCGLVYELALVALGSYLIGDSVGQASIVLAIMVFAMGIGALSVKPLQRHAAVAFAGVEILLALLGGLSVLALYAAYAWLDLYTPAMVLVTFVVGLLIGAEIPLLMVLLQRIRRQEAGAAVSDLFAADYVGGLLGGLAFPFLLLPVFGLVRGALLVGALNALAGLTLVVVVFRRDLSVRARAVLATLAVLVTATLAGTYLVADDFEVSARQALYDDPIVVAERSRYQEIVMTREVTFTGHADVRLFLDGDLQFSSVDEYRYHESLVHPVLAGPHRRVLILGGGDGLALREVLRYPDVDSATLVELDPAMIQLARHDPRLSALNAHSFDDPRAHVVNADALTWLRAARSRYDAVIVDMPDPDATATAKLYSQEFYGLASRVVAPGGRMVVQSGSPYFAPKSYWCIESSIRAAGWRTTPYHVDVPTFGDWGYVLAQRDRAPALRLSDDVPRLRYLTPSVLRAATVFPADRPRLDMPPSTLTRPRLMEYENSEWQDY